MRIFIYLLSFTILFVSCKKDYWQEATGLTMGTSYKIIYSDPEQKVQKGDFDSLLQVLNLSLSTYIDSSVISKVNRQDSVIEVDKHFATVFNTSKEVWFETNGAFDPSILSLIEAWGFGSGDTIRMDSMTVDSLMKLKGFGEINLHEEENRYYIMKKREEIQLDFSAIAKGYAVDVIAGFLTKNGSNDFMVEIGGEVRTNGRNKKNEWWKLGIERPAENQQGQIFAVLSLKNKSLATSGNYRNYYIKGGRKYVHTINPMTGYPELSVLLSASVVTKKCMIADAYATAFMVMGKEKSIRFLKEKKELESMLIFSEKDSTNMFISTGLEKVLTKTAK